MSSEDEHFRRVVQTRAIRVAVRAICIRGDALLVQRPADDPTACYAFIGGQLEVGDTFESRMRAELDEELGAKLVRAQYLFVVENRFRVADGLVHALEHFVRVDIEGEHSSREPHLTQRWVPLAELAQLDLRPTVVRDALVDGSWTTVKHLQVPLED
jgi:ADP-ribose pyrophosphatase YjhB (NUDIX family)